MQTRWRCKLSHSVLDLSLCLLMLLSYQNHTSSQEIPPVQITPASEYFEEGKPASLRCLFSEPAPGQSGDLSLLWSRVGGLPSSSSIVNSRTESNAVIFYQSTLTFAPGALDNQIAISCTATAGSFSRSSSYRPRVILVPEEPIIVAPYRSDDSGNLTWTCHSHGASQSAPNVYWRDGRGASLLSGVSRTTTVEQIPSENTVYSIALTITREAKDFVAANSLVCVVVHSLAQYYSTRLATQVLDLPRVSKNGSDVVYVSEAARMSLSCVVTAGHPPATNITWTKDGQAVTSSIPGRYEHVNLTSADLVIISVTKYDTGDYLCWATSLLGTTGFIFPTTLVVRYRPQIPRLANGTTVEATAGGNVVLQCPVDAFPRPTRIQWHRVIRGQTHLVNTSSSPRYSGGSVTNQQFDLAISSLQVSDAGVYLCVVTNQVGSGTGPNMTLIVTSPSALIQQASTDKTTAVVFGVISLVLFVIIIIIIVATCYLCKCSKGHERARVGPVMDPTVKHSGRLFLPSLNPETELTSHLDERAHRLATSLTPLPPAMQGDHHTDTDDSGLPPETLETPVFRLPPLDPETRSQDTPFRAYLPPWSPQSGHISHSDDDSTTLSTPVTLLHPDRQGDHHEDGCSNGPLPETLEIPVFRLPPLDPDTRTYDTPFKWSAHLQNNSQASNGNVFKVSGGQVNASLDQTLVLREKLAMMK